MLLWYRINSIPYESLLLTAYTSGPQVMESGDMVRSYTQISQEKAKQMMEQMR